MDKREVRRLVKERFKALSDGQKLSKSGAVIEQLRQFFAQRQISVAALFSPLRDEVQIGEFVEEMVSKGDCRVVLPRVIDDGPNSKMEFFDYRASSMQVGSYGILEPQSGEPCDVSEIDVMIVPGVAFGRDGSRLGRGKGFYDRYLSREGFRAECIGVCLDFQLFDTLPVEPHDRGMDCVISNEL